MGVGLCISFALHSAALKNGANDPSEIALAGQFVDFLTDSVYIFALTIAGVAQSHSETT
jgi:hypothetical protein